MQSEKTGPLSEANHEQHRRGLRSLVREVAGAVDTTGLELMGLLRMVANQAESAVDERLSPDGLSGPRWALLLRLLAEERRSDQEWASPTHLSRSQSVSKNTISALLRGLEDQGLIERTLDPEDKRAFRISLTAAGRRLLITTVPGHVAFLNDLASPLTIEERTQLIHLLSKLHRSLPPRERWLESEREDA